MSHRLKLKLIRYYTPNATLGIILHDFQMWATIERPWRDNKKNVSCIPEGVYVCQRVDSPRHGDTFEVKHVVNRTHILFHVANTSDDVKGCIGVAKHINGERFKIDQSKVGFKDFMDSMADHKEFEITIKQFRPHD